MYASCYTSDFSDTLTWKYRVRKAFNVTLATSLVHFYPPKNHSRALRIIEDILTEDPDNVAALLARGFVLQYAKRWEDAAELFAKVVRLNPDDLDAASRAKEECAWCIAKCGDLQAAADELRQVINDLEGIEGHEEDKARCWWKLGCCYWDMGGKTSCCLYQLPQLITTEQTIIEKKHTSTLSRL